MPQLPIKPVWTTTDKETVRLYQGDTLKVLQRLPSSSVQCIVTSPPYWGLRDYQVEGQLGSEANPDCGRANGNCAEQDWQTGCFVCRLVLVFREARRVLRDDGLCFLNLGDSYASGEVGRHDQKEGQWFTGSNAVKHDALPRKNRKMNTRIPQGNLVGIPWRVALALQADSWILRQDIIWCLSGGTWLYTRTKKGDMPMMLRDAARLDPRSVQLWNGEKWTQVLGWSRTSRNADEMEIVLRSGERISCTPNHKFPTKRGLLEASEIQVGDILERVSLPDPEPKYSPEAVTLDAAWFVGMYLAEGSRGPDSLHFAGHVKEIERWERIQKISAWYGGSATLNEDGNRQLISVHGKLLLALVETYIGGTDAKTKHLKVKCWRHNNNWLLELLLGYLEGDGHWDQGNNRWRIGFARNDSWERDLRTLAARIGFRLVLKQCFATGFGQTFPSNRGEIRFVQSGHHNEKDVSEVIEIRKARCREVYDVGVADAPNVFALASGTITHNSKRAPMPESIRNRFTKSHEYVFMLAKKPGYYCDMEAVKEVAIRAGDIPGGDYNTTGKEDKVFGQRRKADGRLVSSCPVPEKRNKRSVWSINSQEVLAWLSDNAPEVLSQYLEEATNKEDVWPLSSSPYPGSHFATFPEALVETIIKCGTSEHGCCVKCGSPWERVVEKSANNEGYPNGPGGRKKEYEKHHGSLSEVARWDSSTVGWEPSCGCNSQVKPCTVMDIFVGSGTTCSVALVHGRHSIGIDLSETYLQDHAAKRIIADCLGRPGLAHLVPLEVGNTIRGTSLLKR